MTERAHSPRSRPRGPSRPVSRVRLLVRSERGTAVVEFALVALPLFLILFGIIDFARALNYYNDLTQLAGQGARAAAVNRSPNGSALSADGRCSLAGNNSIQCQLVKDYTSSGELKGGIKVCINQVSGVVSAVGAPVTVTTSYKFTFIPLIGNAVKAASITLTASQSERQEGTASYAPGCVSGP
jgi:Flp pilus assembly protein TadG